MFRLLLAVGCVWIFVYTLTYGVWEWKQKNKHGAVFVFLLSIFELALSVYTVAVY